MAELVVTPMLSHEAQAVATLMRSVIEPLHYYNARARTEELAKYGVRELQRAVLDDPLSVLVARNGDNIVGFCVSRYDDALVWLTWFGVHDDWRAHGVGRSLLDALGNTLRVRNAHKIWCDTRSDNVPSQAVLSRIGFAKIGELKNHWYGQDFWLWEWYPEIT